MFPLLAAFLLAAWLIQPWGYIDAPASPVLAQSYVAANTRSANSHPDAPDRLFAKEQRALEDATPSPTVAPPSPAPLTPTPPSTPTPVPVVQPLPPDGIEALVCSYPWPCQEALSVAQCESGVDAAGKLDGIYAQSSRNSYGLFQINSIHARRFPDFWESWMDPAKNTAWAFQIWSEQGWRPWNCRPR